LALNAVCNKTQAFRPNLLNDSAKLKH